MLYYSATTTKKEYLAICDNVGEFGRPYAVQNKPFTKGHILHDSIYKIYIKIVNFIGTV